MSKTRGSALLVLAKVANVLLQIVAIRYYLATLGKEGYSLLVFFAALSGFMAVLDFGLSVGAQREATRALAEGDDRESARILRTFAALTIRIGLLACAAYLVVWLLLPLPLGSLSSAERMQVFIAAGIQYLCVWFGLMLATVLMAYERFGQAASTNLGYSALPALAGIVVASATRSPVALLWSNAICTAVALAVTYAVVCRVVGSGLIGGAPEPEIAGRLWSTGAKTYAHRMTAAVGTTVDKLLIGAYAGALPVTSLGVGGRIPEVLYDMLSPVNGTTVPELTRLLEGDRDVLRRRIEKNTALAWGLSLAILLVPSAAGGPIIRSVFGADIPLGGWICLLLGIHKSIELLMASLSMAPYAKGRPDWLVPFSTFNGVLTLVLTIPMYRIGGVVGVAAMNLGITAIQIVPFAYWTRAKLGCSLRTGRWVGRLAAMGAVGGLVAAGVFALSRGPAVVGQPWLGVPLAAAGSALTLALLIVSRLCPLPSGLTRRAPWLRVFS